MANTMTDHNATLLHDHPQWIAKPELKMPNWAEAVILVTLLFGGMFLTRRRDYSIFGGKPGPYKSILDSHSDDARPTDELLEYDSENDDDRQSYCAQEKRLPKTRSCCGLCTVYTPNSSRFKNHIHSRLFQKFPFLVEMFYWILNYLFYRMTTVLSNEIFAGTGIWEAAKLHALAVLEIEEFSLLSFLFPVREVNVQRWFMDGRQDALTFMDRFYSLVHIPGTIAFIAWYYYFAPSHATFTTVRRTMTLTNFMAFLTFIFFPLMPPRLLPKEYGFLDTVHMEDAESMIIAGKYVNSLAAMPSMHFGYAFAIGCTFIYHSGIFRTRFEKYEARKNIFWKTWYILVGVAYPTAILVTIIATANHYFMDVLVALLYCVVAFFCNRIWLVLLPMEDMFLWLIRAEKPIPSTGERFHRRGGRI